MGGLTIAPWLERQEVKNGPVEAPGVQQHYLVAVLRRLPHPAADNPGWDCGLHHKMASMAVNTDTTDHKMTVLHVQVAPRILQVGLQVGHHKQVGPAAGDAGSLQVVEVFGVLDCSIVVEGYTRAHLEAARKGCHIAEQVVAGDYTCQGAVVNRSRWEGPVELLEA